MMEINPNSASQSNKIISYLNKNCKKIKLICSKKNYILIKIFYILKISHLIIFFILVVDEFRGTFFNKKIVFVILNLCISILFYGCANHLQNLINTEVREWWDALTRRQLKPQPSKSPKQILKKPANVLTRL
jgi:hypothetical protein